MKVIKDQIIMFLVMILVGMGFNPMNILAYKINHLYISKTLFYGGILMASNMLWAHEIVHYLQGHSSNINIFITGIILSILTSKFLLREQFNIDSTQWLKRMIPHHSTALTTTNKLLENRNINKNSKLYKLARDIIIQQEKEIIIMKNLIKNK
tara:strand:- start:914 stop:1372 length:459 start_codon:yes stop_codon:yes gene_type:complete